MDHPEPARRVYPRLSALLLIAAGALSAQVYPPGGYPPGGTYPPGGYPPGGNYPQGRGRTGPGLPIPGRGSKSKTESAKEQPLPNFRGKLKQMDSKTITLALDDDRLLQFRRTDKTKFMKGGVEVKNPKFNPGDQISIEGPEDANGGMTAVNVYWEKAAAAPETTTTGETEAATPRAPATEIAPPPAKADADDPGRPRLQRGRPADPAREHVPDPPPSLARGAANPAGELPPPNTTGAPVVFREEGTAPVQRRGDDLIRKATDTALEFTESLPNYVCQEMMSRYASQSNPPNWTALDVVSAEVIYENHKESYRNIAVNGKKINKKMEEMDGAWSTGEFGTVLIDLFSPATAADFRYKKDGRAGGVNAKVYDFNVDHEHSHWDIHFGAQTYSPAYKGSVWIDPQTARVLRIEMQAYGFPTEFPSDHVESATDYENIRLGDAHQYLLPVHSETLSCQRSSNLCSRNAIDFRNYHKYAGESTIKFSDK